MSDRRFSVYILSNVARTLYIGLTSDVEKRIWEHRQKVADGFTREYSITMLVHLEEFARADDAIAREKQLKNWHREKKVWLIEQENPNWFDLAHDWFDVGCPWDRSRVTGYERSLRFGRDDGGRFPGWGHAAGNERSHGKLGMTGKRAITAAASCTDSGKQVIE